MTRQPEGAAVGAEPRSQTRDGDGCIRAVNREAIIRASLSLSPARKGGWVGPGSSSASAPQSLVSLLNASTVPRISAHACAAMVLLHYCRATS